MNDDELITVVREQRAKVPMDTPVEQIISRGRVVRARRRIPRLVAALAVVAGAALTVTTLAPADHQPGAWAVARRADGTISVTIRELADAAGLQRALRADGVPTSLTFPGAQNPACGQPQSMQGSPAWAVARQPDGTISVAISEMSDAAGLQRALRADGVPVSVTFSGQPGLSCPAQPAHGQPRDH